MLSIKLLGQLLCYCATAAGTVLLQYHAFDYCTQQSLEIYSAMVTETHVLSGHESLYQIW